MFPWGREMNNTNRKLFVNITKFTCLSPPSSDLTQNTLVIRRDQLSDLFCPDESVYAVFTKKSTSTKCAFDIQGFGSVMMSVDAHGFNKSLSLPEFIHYDPQCSKEPECVHTKDNGHCAVLCASLVNYNVKLDTTDRYIFSDEKANLVGVEGPIFLLKMVSLSCQSLLELPLVQLVSVEDTLDLLCDSPSLLTLGDDQFFTGSPLQMEAVNVFQSESTLNNERTVTINEHMDTYSLSSSNSSTSCFSDGYNDIIANENYQSNLGMSQRTPEMGIAQQIPEVVQVTPNLYSDGLAMPEQHFHQGHVSAPLYQLQQQDPQFNYDFGQFTAHQNTVVEYQQTPYLFQQSQIPCHQPLHLDLQIQNHGYALATNLPNLGLNGAVWDSNGMLLQVCTEPHATHHDNNMGFMLPSTERNPDDVHPKVATPVYSPPTPPLEILGGSCSGNVANKIGWNNVGKGSLAKSTSGKILKKKTKEMDYRNQKSSAGRRSSNDTIRNGHVPMRGQGSASRTSSLTEGGIFHKHDQGANKPMYHSINNLIMRLVVEMLGYVDNNIQINTESKTASSFVNTTNTTSTVQQQQQGCGENGGASTSTGRSGESSGSSVASACTTPRPVQQYILGCAGSSRSKLLDPENITLKLLLETPYSPRTESIRNFELEEYQKILAEEELEKRIDELRAMDREREKRNGGNNNNDVGGGDANQAR